jgi:hypothetical protein
MEHITIRHIKKHKWTVDELQKYNNTHLKNILLATG